jgi:hypothetical protein
MNLARRIMELDSKSEYDVMRCEDIVNGALGFGPEICDPKILSKAYKGTTRQALSQKLPSIPYFGAFFALSVSQFSSLYALPSKLRIVYLPKSIFESTPRGQWTLPPLTTTMATFY